MVWMMEYTQKYLNYLYNKSFVHICIHSTVMRLAQNNIYFN